MQRQQATAVARLPIHWQRFIRVYYKLPRTLNLYYALRQRSITVTDLVCMLAARRYTAHAIAALTGKPITKCPTIDLRYWNNGGSPRLIKRRTLEKPICSWRDARITYVNKEVSRKYGHKLRTQCTPRTLHMCSGIPWRTLQRAMDCGWIEVRA
jgi:hypothetical protein